MACGIDRLALDGQLEKSRQNENKYDSLDAEAT